MPVDPHAAYLNSSELTHLSSFTEPGIDPLASSLYQQILPSIPNIKVKGTPTGDFSATTPSYPRTDPDCWWTFSNCTTPKLAGLSPDVSTCPEPNTWGELTYQLDFWSDWTF